jgi:hypothetical protein
MSLTVYVDWFVATDQEAPENPVKVMGNRVWRHSVEVNVR